MIYRNSYTFQAALSVSANRCLWKYVAICMPINVIGWIGVKIFNYCSNATKDTFVQSGVEIGTNNWKSDVHIYVYEIKQAFQYSLQNVKILQISKNYPCRYEMYCWWSNFIPTIWKTLTFAFVYIRQSQTNPSY